MNLNFSTSTFLLGLCLNTFYLSFSEETNAKNTPAIDPNSEALLLGNRDYYPQTWLEQGRVHFVAQEYQKAIVAFYNATRLQPKSASIWFNLGYTYFKNKQYHEAITSFLQAYQLKDKDKYLYHVCLSYFKANEIHQALRHLRYLLSKNTKHGHAWKLMAQIYEHLDQFREAKSAYTKAHGLLSKDQEVLYALEKLENIKTLKLSIPKIYASEVIIEKTEPEMFTGKLPMSKIFDHTDPDFVTQERMGLVPLEESYHLNFDSPKTHQFKPSAEQNWTPPRSNPETPSKLKPPKAVKPKIKAVFDDL